MDEQPSVAIGLDVVHAVIERHAGERANVLDGEGPRVADDVTLSWDSHEKRV